MYNAWDAPQHQPMMRIWKKLGVWGQISHYNINCTENQPWVPQSLCKMCAQASNRGAQALLYGHRLPSLRMVLQHSLSTRYNSFWIDLFGLLEEVMTGQQFADDEEVKRVVPKWFCTQPKIFNSDAFQKPVDQWANCIEKQEDYVEK